MPKAGSDERGDVDGRIRKSRDRVLTTAFDLLSQSGIGGFSVDEVARRSGVAKTTIYRHWPSREALVLDAASRISAEQAVPDSGSLDAEQDLAYMVTATQTLDTTEKICPMAATIMFSAANNASR